MSLSCSASVSAFFANSSPSFLATLLFSAGFFEVSGLGAGELSLAAFFDSSSFFFFFSCFAKSSAFVSLVNAIIFPSGDQTGLPAPLGRSVNKNESPPAIGKIDNWGDSGFPSFSMARRKRRYFPSGDQRGVES